MVCETHWGMINPMLNIVNYLYINSKNVLYMGCFKTVNMLYQRAMKSCLLVHILI